MLLRIVSPLGDVEIAGYGEFTAGATFAPRPEDVPRLIGQTENFEPADDDARAALAAYNAPAEPVEAAGASVPVDPTSTPPADNAPPTENEAQ